MRRLACLTCLLATVLGCDSVGTETGNPPAARDASLALMLRSTNSGLVDVDGRALDDGALSVNSAALATDSVELLGCIGVDHAELGPVAWDLLHPQAHGLTTLLPSFCGIELELGVADASLGARLPGLEGASLWVTATRADGTPVELRSSTALDLTYQDATRPVDAGKVVVVFDAAAWFSQVDVDDLTPDPDGVVRLSPTSNPLLLQAVEQRADDGATLRPETPDDGVLDD